MNTEELVSLFKKYKVRIPKEKQGQSECYECKRHHKYSLTWTSFLYEYEEKYYCFEHIVNILLQQENKQLKDLIDTILTFSFFKEECPLNFIFEDNSKEDEAQNIFYSDEYCENNCNDIYKECWLKYFKELQGSDSNE